MTLKPDPLSYPPRGLSREEAARYVGLGTTKFDELIADRRMPKPRQVDGRTIWDVDTARRYETVNGVAGTGGSIDGAGPVVAGGMVFVNSGYSRFGGMPGNVLLAFAP